jgi:hypothetical protein
MRRDITPVVERYMVKDFYTVTEMADMLRVRPGTVRNRLLRRDNSVPPSTTIGRRRLFPLEAYEVWKQRLLKPQA